MAQMVRNYDPEDDALSITAKAAQCRNCLCWLQERSARSHLLWFRHVNRIVQWYSRELLIF